MNKFFNEYQQQLRRGMVIGESYDAVAHCALGLVAEAGEVADLIKKSQYTKPKHYLYRDMALELGDALWYLTNLADMHGYSLQQIAERNIEKLAERHPGGAYNLAELTRFA